MPRKIFKYSSWTAGLLTAPACTGHYLEKAVGLVLPVLGLGVNTLGGRCVDTEGGKAVVSQIELSCVLG